MMEMSGYSLGVGTEQPPRKGQPMPTHTDLAWQYLTVERHRPRTVWDGKGNASTVTDTVTLMGDPTHAAVVLGIARINDIHRRPATSKMLVELGLPRSTVAKSLKRLRQYGELDDGVQVRHVKQGNSYAFQLSSQ